MVFNSKELDSNRTRRIIIDCIKNGGKNKNQNQNKTNKKIPKLAANT